MEQLEIKDPEDWYRVKSLLRVQCFRFLMFLDDYDRMCNSIELKIKDLCLIDIELRKNKNSIHFQQLRKNKVDEINETLKIYSKILLIATLAKR